MRFMMIVKHAEPVGQPPKEFMEAVGSLAEVAKKSGKIIDTGGLAPTSTGARVQLRGGKVTVSDGPFTEAKEVVGGYAIFELSSRQEAVEAATNFMDLHRRLWPGWQGETEVRQMCGPEDFAPKK